MSEPTIAATVEGGVVGVGAARFVRIENLYVGASALPAQPPQEVADGAIPPCPYPGLAYFGPQDAALFFGREAAIAQLEAAVARRTLTALVGASGSGKSSVVLAGLAPRLHARGGWRFSQFRVGIEADKNPFRALARALVPLLGERGAAEQLEEVQKLAAKLESGAVDLPNVMGACRANNPGKRILLIADQFEEAFTLVGDEPRRYRFIDCLLAGFPDRTDGAPPDICLALTLRADFFGMALRHRPLADALQDRVVNLGPMTREELREAITRPAGHVTFDDGLVDTLLDDVASQPGSLPLLQFALREMWGRLEKPRMTHAGYEAIGGIKGALKLRAQAIYDAATRKGEDAHAVLLFRRLFTRLVNLGEGVQDTRRIVGREELGPEAWQLAQRLAGEDNRLVVTAAPEAGQETAEVAHEALIQNWPALVDWINRDRAFQSWLRQMKPRVDEWRAHPEDEGTLLRGGQLALAEELRGRRGDELNDDERGYIEASLALRETEKRHEKEALAQEQARLAEVAAAQANTARLQRRVRWALVGFGVLVALGIGAVYWQYSTNLELKNANNDQALKLEKQQADLADARLALNKDHLELEDKQASLDKLAASLNSKEIELKHQHATLLGELARVEGLRGNPDRALRFAAEGTRADPALPAGTVVASTAAAQLAAAVSQAEWRLSLGGHQNVVNSAAFSPDGSRVVTASTDKTARIWDAATGKPIAVLRGHEAAVTSAAFSPDGSQIVTASFDKTARIWDAATGKPIAVLSGHENIVNSAAFSPDGSRIVTASWDNTARIWDAATAKQIGTLAGHENFVYSAAFSSDGSRIVTASADKTARIWDAATRKQIGVLSGHENIVMSAAFNRAGTRIVTASFDKTARLWDVATGNQVALLSGHDEVVLSAAFSPDGSHIVTASGDKTARIWDAASAKQVAILRGHESSVSRAAFSPDGSRIVTASHDRTARIWDVETGNRIAVLSGHEDVVVSAAFSRDGARIVTASWDYTARIWDAKTGKQLKVLRGHGDRVNGAAFSPDGAHVVTASWDKTARIWDAATGAEIAVLIGHEGALSSAAFSPDGTRIVTTSWDDTARVWDAVTAKQITVFRGHGLGVNSAAFSPDGTRIVTASQDKTARIWDAATGHEIAILGGHAAVSSAVFSPDGSRIVTAPVDDTARIWDVATSKQIKVLSGHENGVASAAFSPDGTHIVTASADKTARVWDAATGVEIAVLNGHDDALTSADFSPDGLRVVTTSKDRTARIWDVHFAMMSTKELLIEACARRLNGLTKLTREEMRLSDFPEGEALVDVCEGVE